MIPERTRQFLLEDSDLLDDKRHWQQIVSSPIGPSSLQKLSRTCILSTRENPVLCLPTHTLTLLGLESINTQILYKNWIFIPRQVEINLFNSNLAGRTSSILYLARNLSLLPLPGIDCSVEDLEDCFFSPTFSCSRQDGIDTALFYYESLTNFYHHIADCLFAVSPRIWAGLSVQKRTVAFLTSGNKFTIKYNFLIDYQGRSYFNLGGSPTDIILHRGRITYKLKDSKIYYKLSERAFLLQKSNIDNYDFEKEIDCQQNKLRIRVVFEVTDNIPHSFTRNGRLFQILRLFQYIPLKVFSS